MTVNLSKEPLFEGQTGLTPKIRDGQKPDTNNPALWPGLTHRIQPGAGAQETANSRPMDLDDAPQDDRSGTVSGFEPCAARAAKKGFLHAEDPWSADQTGVS
ncbi:MAG: hypothetical protein WA746_31625 [Isosphaeraceae bacterium]